MHIHTHTTAKAHHQMMKKHSYENIQLQALAERKKKKVAATSTSPSKLDEQLKNCADDPLQHTYVNTGEHHTYINVKTIPPADYTTHKMDGGVAIPPPPPPAIAPQKRDSSGSSPSAPRDQVAAPTPTSPTLDLPSPRTNESEARKGRSPTPPIPERKYSDTDIRMTPPPPLPQRHYSGGEDVLSPPPLPERRYTATDLGELKPAAAAGTVALAQGQGQVHNSPQLHVDTRDRSKSLDSDYDSGNVKYEVSGLGHQYALVTKGKVVEDGANNNEKKGENAPPPLPKRFRERFNEDSPFNSTENISQAGAGAAAVRNNTSYYVDIDHSGEVTSNKTSYTDTIAYAVVKVDGGSVNPPTSDGRRPIRRVKTPRPYENAVSSSSGTPPPPALTDSVKPKRPPAYEEIDNDNSEQMDGKMATISVQLLLLRTPIIA